MTESTYRIRGATGDWEVVIGLEVHAQVTSNAKLFSGAATAFGAEPNAQVSLVDAAMPGMLPVPNKECIRQAVRTGMAIEAKINAWSRFDRKNYFYADLPQGYRDQPALPSAGGRRTPRDRGRREGRDPRGQAHRHRADSPRAGRGQADARPASVDELRRPQPLGRGADGDRQPARHALAGRGRGLCAQAAEHPALRRLVRRQHGRRIDARGRQRLGTQAGPGIRHADRDQERQFGALRHADDRARGATPGRSARGRRQDRAGDPAVRSEHRDDALDAEQGRRARLPLLPRSRPAAARARRRFPRGMPGEPARAARRQAQAVHRCAGAVGLQRRRADRRGRHRALVRGAARRGCRGAGQG